MSNLFDLPESLSPRLQWVKRHGLVVKKRPDGVWACYLTDETLGVGETEEEACLNLCEKAGIRHWNLDTP